MYPHEFPHPERKTFSSGNNIGEYQVISLIGQGGYGDIYSVSKPDSNQKYAMKTEPLDSPKQALEVEHVFMQEIQGSPFFPQLIDYGTTLTHRYLVMELLGPSLSNTRRQLTPRRFSLCTVLRLGVFMMKCIEVYHKIGLIHRDIKPGNFLLHNNSENPLSLIDYGLSKRYLDPETHLPIPERTKSGFRGTAKYASLRVHEFHDASKRDDLISWVYSMIELIDGRLPWFNIHEASDIYEMKKQFKMRTLLHSFPPDFQLIWAHISSLSFHSEPNYNMIISTIYNMIIVNGLDLHSPFDWEGFDQEKIDHFSPTPNLPKMKDIDLKDAKNPQPHVFNENDFANNYIYENKCECLLL